MVPLQVESPKEGKNGTKSSPDTVSTGSSEVEDDEEEYSDNGEDDTKGKGKLVPQGNRGLVHGIKFSSKKSLGIRVGHVILLDVDKEKSRADRGRSSKEDRPPSGTLLRDQGVSKHGGK